MSTPIHTGVDACSFPGQEQLLSQRSMARAYSEGAAEKNVVESIRTAPVFYCRLCGGLLNDHGLSFKQVPVCNRFTASKEPVERHDLHLDQCLRCQLIQLCEPLPVVTVMPRLPWIKYREPEGHLDTVVDRLLSGHCSKAGSSFGVGPFDQPLLSRLEQHGLSSLVLETRPPQPGERKGFPYLETWQLGLNKAKLAEIADT